MALNKETKPTKPNKLQIGNSFHVFLYNTNDLLIVWFKVKITIQQ